ncbi:MAG TPA: hypothetical protein PLK13_02355 [Xanthobacteraceae bacterium]|jgi:hypothetical protein|nr:hypothetical protein [Xanthobacteraceae bacterium]HQS46379.1 hypothetical protein [Xanthobacteraceae bacterium]
MDPHVSPGESIDNRLNVIQRRLVDAGTSVQDIRTVELLENIDAMREELELFLANSGPNIVFDISSMPKWWSFPMIRFLMESDRVETLVVTYTSALSYGRRLSSDPKALGRLPTFDEPRVSDRYDEVIIGVGFAPLGLKDLFEENVGKIRYLFPFPPGPPNFHRNWHFLRSLNEEVENRALTAEDRWHVHMYDVPSAFDALCKATGSGNQSCALAPFGPKTLSLAMCLFALAVDGAGKEPVHVFYTQPQRYALDYTTGIGSVDGVADIKGYCLRIAGRDLYTL